MDKDLGQLENLYASLVYGTIWNLCGFLETTASLTSRVNILFFVFLSEC